MYSGGEMPAGASSPTTCYELCEKQTLSKVAAAQNEDLTIGITNGNQCLCGMGFNIASECF